MNYQINEAQDPAAIVILAHGAGAGMDHPFMADIAGELAARGFTVVRFNFPYMDAGRRSPGSPKANIQAWREMVATIQEELPDLPVFMAGKSYGGRMGSHLLAVEPELPVRGIIYLGFPLHAPGKDSTDRAAHLPDIKVPQLFLQGVKDKLATIEMMREVTDSLSDATLVEFEGADHSFKVPKSMGISHDQMMQSLADTMAEWIRKC